MEVINSSRFLPPPPFERGEEFLAFLDEFGLIPKCLVTRKMLDTWAADLRDNIAYEQLFLHDREVVDACIKHWYQRNHSRRKQEDLLQLELF